MQQQAKTSLRKCLLDAVAFVAIVLFPFAIAAVALAVFPAAWPWLAILDMRSWSLQVWLGVIVTLGIVLVLIRLWPTPRQG